MPRLLAELTLKASKDALDALDRLSLGVDLGERGTAGVTQVSTL